MTQEKFRKKMEEKMEAELDARAATPPVDSRPPTVEEWQDTPSPNPRYRGATPADVGRALIRKPTHLASPVTHRTKSAEPPLPSTKAYNS